MSSKASSSRWPEPACPSPRRPESAFRVSTSLRPSRVDWIFRRLQLVSAASYSLGHGTTDAQKTMGIIAILLFSTGQLGPEFYVPFWVVLAAHAALALGTFAGGW